MYTVYKITNNINNKCYIGSSIRVEQRWKQHINASKNPNNLQYNYPLYNAFRLYGLDNFSFEILKDDFESIEEMENYEYQMIELYHTTDHEYGYNQTKFTSCHTIGKENIEKHLEKISQRCALVDKDNNILETYISYAEAARIHTGKENQTSTIANVCKGITSSYKGKYFRNINQNNEVEKIDFKNQHGKKSIIGISVENPTEEIYFDSISEAATAMNTDRWSITQSIQGIKRYSIVKGYIWREIDLHGNIIENAIDIEDRIEEYNKYNPIIDGERHNLTEWCKIYNISMTSVNQRIKKGMSVVEAITTPKRR